MVAERGVRRGWPVVVLLLFFVVGVGEGDWSCWHGGETYGAEGDDAGWSIDFLEERERE